LVFHLLVCLCRDAVLHRQAGLYVPDLFDDGDLDEMGVKVLKAFFDMSLQEAMTRQRWGATKFTKGQVRMAADNKYDADAEPFQTVVENHVGKKMPLVLGYTGTSHETFMEMIALALPSDISPANIEAILKRTSVVLNTEWWVYVRPAGLHKDVTIERHSNKGLFITEAARETLAEWTDDKSSFDEVSFQANVNREQAYLLHLLGPSVAPMSEREDAAEHELQDPVEDIVVPEEMAAELADESDYDPMGHGFDMDGLQEPVEAGGAPLVQEPAIVVKKEQQEASAFNIELMRNRTTPIDLTSPSPQSKKRRIHEALDRA
jgi:hypothetical protein